MDHSEFEIGTEFYTGSGLWRCTDIGTRTIVAVQLRDGSPTLDHVAPFADAVEIVFDEYDLPGLSPVPITG